MSTPGYMPIMANEFKSFLSVLNFPQPGLADFFVPE